MKILFYKAAPFNYHF